MKLSYLSYFFTYETHIPDGIGFALFGPWHLLWLSVIFAICVRYVWIYKKGDERKKRRMDGLTACSLVVWIVVRAIYIAVIHEAFLYELPFHLCSMAGILCAVHCLTKWKWLGQVLYTICLPGTVLALFSSTGVVLTQGSNTTLSAGGLPSDSTINLLTGNVAGPLGCCAILVIVACGLYLLVRGHMQLSTFVPYLAVCVLVPWLLPNLNELPALSAPWEYVRQRIYLEKYILLSGSMLFGGIFLACEPVVQPNRWSSRLIYGLFLGAMATAFRYYSVYETGVCFAIVLAGAFPEWLDRLAQRAERIRFMRKEEKRLAQHREP